MKLSGNRICFRTQSLSWRVHTLCSCAKPKQGSSVLQKSHWEGILSVTGSITHMRIGRFRVQFYQAGENRKLPVVKYHGCFMTIPVCRKPCAREKFRALSLIKTQCSRHSCSDSSVGVLTGEPNSILWILCVWLLWLWQCGRLWVLLYLSCCLLEELQQSWCLHQLENPCHLP